MGVAARVGGAGGRTIFTVLAAIVGICPWLSTERGALLLKLWLLVFATAPLGG